MSANAVPLAPGAWLRSSERHMDRLTLSSEKMAPAARDQVARMHRGIVEEVVRAVERDHVVVVGMAQNPFVKNARKALDAAGVKYTYLEYGSYLSKWKERLALKLWAGFPTFPMVFVDGTLIGGFTELKAQLAEGAIK
jgi:glutaredoxin-related protein